MALKAVLFDLDGTLLDTAPDFILSVNCLRERHGQPPLADETIRAEVSNGARALTRLASGLADDDPALEPLRLELLAIYSELLGLHSQLFPGMADSLAWLEARGLAWGIVTNKPSQYTDPLLARLALPFRPAAVVCPDHVGRSKPDPAPLLLACQHCGCEPAEAIYLGDHVRDIEAGRAAGMATAACDWGYIGPAEDVASWGACHRIDSPGDIVALVEKLM